MGVTPRQSVAALAITTLATPEPTGAALNLRFTHRLPYYVPLQRPTRLFEPGEFVVGLRPFSGIYFGLLQTKR
jgi:hypothetical protein